MPLYATQAAYDVVNTKMLMRAFPSQQYVAMAFNGRSAGSLQQRGFREKLTPQFFDLRCPLST